MRRRCGRNDAASTVNQKMGVTVIMPDGAPPLPLNITAADVVAYVPEPFLGLGLTYTLRVALPAHLTPGTRLCVSVPTVAPVRITRFASSGLRGAAVALDRPTEQLFTGALTPDAVRAGELRIRVAMVQVLSFERQFLHWVRLGSPASPCAVTLCVEPHPQLRPALRQGLRLTMESGGTPPPPRRFGSALNAVNSRELLGTLSTEGGGGAPPKAAAFVLQSSANARLVVRMQGGAFTPEHMVPAEKSCVTTVDGAGRRIQATLAPAAARRMQLMPQTPCGSGTRLWCLQDIDCHLLAALRIERTGDAADAAPTTLVGQLLSAMMFVTAPQTEARDPIVLRDAADEEERGKRKKREAPKDAGGHEEMQAPPSKLRPDAVQEVDGLHRYHPGVEIALNLCMS